MRRIGVAIFGLLTGMSAYGQVSPAIFGEYIEARSGHVYTCGCVFSGEQVTGGKEAILAWSFQGGELRGVSLAGVKAAAVIVGEGHLGITATPRKSVLYLDSAASEDQRQAILELLSKQHAAVLGAVIRVHAAPILFQSDGARREVNIGGTVSVVARPARLPEDAHPGSQVWYSPFFPTTDSTLSMTLYFKYWDQDFSRQWWHKEPGITGYMGTFALAPRRRHE